MILNRVEYLLMNNPLRAVLQRYVEAPRLLRMGGPVDGGCVLELGCGRGVGTELIFDLFGAGTVDAFDLDPRMVRLARKRLAKQGSDVRLWVGDASAISVPDNTYDAVFDFGIIHHIPDWRRALREVERVLKPGGTFYSEEVLKKFILHPVTRRLLDHPLTDRFDAKEYAEAIDATGLSPGPAVELWGVFAWVTARKASRA